MDDIFSLAKIIGVVLGIPAALLIGLTARKMIREETEKLAERLENSLSERRRLHAWLSAQPFDEADQQPLAEEGWVSVYYRRMRKGLIWLGRSFGSRRGWQLDGLSFCVGLAVTYSVIFLFLGWVLFNSNGRIGDIELLPSDFGRAYRFMVLLLVLVFMGLFIFLGRHYNTIDQYIAQRIGHQLYRVLLGLIAVSISFWLLWPSEEMGLWEWARAVGIAAFGAFMTESILITSVIVVAGSSVVIFSGSFIAIIFIACAIIGLVVGFGGGVVVIGVFGVFLLGVFIVLMALGGIIGHFGVGSILLYGFNYFTVQLILVWMILPIINSSYDWVSWRISRRLALALIAHLRFRQPLHSLPYWLRLRRKSLTKRIRGWRQRYLMAYGHILFDLTVAFVLLLTLAWSLSLAIHGYSRFITTQGLKATFDMNVVLGQFVSDPWGNGFWFTAMLITTLVPTLLHMLAAGYGMAVAWRSGGKEHEAWARILGQPPPVEQPKPTSGEADRLQQRRENLQQAWDLVNKRQSEVRQQRSVETRAEARFRMQQLIENDETELTRIESQLHEIETQLAAIANQPSSEPSNDPADLASLSNAAVTLDQFRDTCYQAAHAYVRRIYLMGPIMWILSVTLLVLPFWAAVYLFEPGPAALIRDVGLSGVAAADDLADWLGWENIALQPVESEVQ